MSEAEAVLLDSLDRFCQMPLHFERPGGAGGVMPVCPIFELMEHLLVVQGRTSDALAYVDMGRARTLVRTVGTKCGLEEHRQVAAGSRDVHPVRCNPVTIPLQSRYSPL